jgi:hypothetical protein
MSNAIVFLVESLRIDSVEIPHTDGQVFLRSLHQQVIMILEEAI